MGLAAGPTGKKGAGTVRGFWQGVSFGVLAVVALALVGGPRPLEVGGGRHAHAR